VDKVLVMIASLTALGYVLLGFLRPKLAMEGLDSTVEMLLQSAPWIIVSLFAAGLMAQFFHAELVARWFGKDAGVWGIVLAAILGLFGTGSRWAVYPLAAGLLTADASPGAVFAFLTSWQLVSLPRLPAEIPFLGVRFTLLRAAMSLFIAILGGIGVGLIMHVHEPLD
jgi:uncharacterized membrane protein YraQ (UPF0718 family)